MSFLYAALGAYLVGQIVLVLVGLVRARREDIPAVVIALALWWRGQDDAMGPPGHVTRISGPARSQETAQAAECVHQLTSRPISLPGCGARPCRAAPSAHR